MAGERKDIYVYTYHGGVYINPTNNCTNNCVFCLRNDRNGVADNDLWLKKEPTAEEIIADLKPLLPVEKITFCGFGEPMMRLDVIKEVAKFAKDNGIFVKINTNGQADLIYGRDVLPDLVGLVDAFSISLNASTAEKYQDECQSIYGEAAFPALLSFTKRALTAGFNTTLSVVDVLPPDEIERCEKIAKDIGATFRVRHSV